MSFQALWIYFNNNTCYTITVNAPRTNTCSHPFTALSTPLSVCVVGGGGGGEKKCTNSLVPHVSPVHSVTMWINFIAGHPCGGIKIFTKWLVAPPDWATVTAQTILNTSVWNLTHIDTKYLFACIPTYICISVVTILTRNYNRVK